MYKTLEEIPIQIREFYEIYYKSRLVYDEHGSLSFHEEDSISYDEEGNEVIVKIKVPDTHEVPYVREKPRYDLKSWDDLGSASNTDYVIAKANEADAWQFFDAWNQWDEIEDNKEPEPVKPEPKVKEIVLAPIEQEWVKSELGKADIEIAKINENSSRSTGTIEEWVKRKESLRDYVRNVDGVLTIVGERP